MVIMNFSPFQMDVNAPKRNERTLSTPNIIKDVVTPGIGDCPPKKLKIDLTEAFPFMISTHALSPGA